MTDSGPFLTKTYSYIHNCCIYKKAHIKLMHFNFSFDSHTNDDIDFEATLRRQFFLRFLCSQNTVSIQKIDFLRRIGKCLFFRME